MQNCEARRIGEMVVAVAVTTVYDSMTTKNDCDEAHDYDDDNDNEEALPLSLSLRNGVPQQCSIAIKRRVVRRKAGT